MQSQDELQFFRKMLQKLTSLVALFSDFKDLEIWQAIEAKRLGAGPGDYSAPEIKLPEWRVFSNPDSAVENRDFKLRRVLPPKGFEDSLEDTVLVERIREVRALPGTLGLSRMPTSGDYCT